MKKFRIDLPILGFLGAPVPCLHQALLVTLSVVLLSSFALAGGVHPLFNLESPTGGPFPSDRFTVDDPSHNTGLRVNLPKPNCSMRPSDCEDLDVINTLDGFNLQPRLSIPFDGPIDVATVTSKTVFLISLGSTLTGGDRGGTIIGINQIVWDTFTNSLHVESDELLAQHTRYALIVTSGVRDMAGNPVEASEAFRQFRHHVRGDYKQALLDAIHAARRAEIREEQIAVASVFTTQSVTAILEKIRDQIKVATPAPADLRLGPGGTRTVFALNQVTGITFNQQTRVDGPLNSVRVPIELLEIIPGAVGQVAFGKYLSPDYQSEPAFIPAVGTHTGAPLVRGRNEMFFNLFLPSGPKPAGGWPVTILGHGGAHKNDFPLRFVAAMASHGIASIAINAVGHGFGPVGTLRVDAAPGGQVTLPAGGRGIDQDGDGMIEMREGHQPGPPRTILSERDGIRQTVADLMQLVRVIDVGIDVDGDSTADLDSSRIYYTGVSFGARLGMQFVAVEPSVRAAGLNIPGGPLVDMLRLGPARRTVLGAELEARVPPLLNSPGVTVLNGVSVPGPPFHENRPLRNGIPLTVRLADGTSHTIQSPMVNTVPGATEIQEVIENTEWVFQSGDAVAYAPHIRQNPLAGVPAKPVILQFADGDQTSPNSAMTAILRAGNLADRATFYRHDLAVAENPVLPRNPHPFIVNINVAAFREVALGAQQQIAFFFASDGKITIHPEPARFFEVPIVLPLPEDLNYIP